MPPWKLRCAWNCCVLPVYARAVRRSNGWLQSSGHATTPPTIGTICPPYQAAFHTTQAIRITPLRKQLKDEAKAIRTAAAEGNPKTSTAGQEKLKNWELTVGIEIHAQLNTARKLFSRTSGTFVTIARLIESRCGNFNQRRTKLSCRTFRHRNPRLLTYISASDPDSCSTSCYRPGMFYTAC